MSFRTFSKAQKALIKRVSLEADRLNVPVYLVGGVVRDALMNRAVRDLDFVVEGEAEKLGARLANGRGGMTAHRKFGTCVCESDNGEHFDIASARKETYDHPGALPRVSKGILEDDLARRDFSLNALAVLLNKHSRFNVIDHHQGVKDLKGKRVRILHNRSFIDDPTRLIRAVRFEQRFGFRLESSTLAAFRAAVSKNAYATVKKQRLFEEFRKVLKEARFYATLKRMEQLDALSFLGSGVKLRHAFLKKMERILKDKEIVKLFASSEIQRVILMIIFSSFNEKRRIRLAEEFGLTREEKKAVLSLKRVNGVMRQINRSKISRGHVGTILADYDPEFCLYLRTAAKADNVRRRLDNYISVDRFIKPVITGDDLIAMGMRAGRGIGDVLKDLTAAKIDKALKTKSDERRYLKTRLKEG